MMRMRNRMELVPADSQERRVLADNLLRALLADRLPAELVESFCASDFETGRFCVLDIDGSAVGTVSLRPLPGRPGEWEVRSLAVVAAWQRGGLAQFMFDRAAAAAKEQGARTLRAVLHPALAPAVAFFRKNGFAREDGAAPDAPLPEGPYAVCRPA